MGIATPSTVKLLAAAAATFVLTGAAPGSAPLLGGCPVFPASSVWNQPVDKLPVAANSDTLISSIGNSGVHADFGNGLYDGSRIGIPYVVVHGKKTPKSRVTFDYADESDKGPYPIPAGVPIEGAPAHANEGDRHALIVDRDSCKLYELYALHRQGSGWAAGSGAIWNLRSNALRPATWTSADAAGLPILPGLARWDGDASTGRINHALRFTVERTRSAYIYPARHQASDSNDPSLPPMGLRVRLKASVEHQQAAATGPYRRPGDEDLRSDPGRQRLELVRVGRAEPALVERSATRAREPHGLRLRSGRLLEAAAVARP